MNKFLLSLFLLFPFLSISQITTSTQWTWKHGDSTLNQPGVYGTKTVFSSTNKPGARVEAVSWTDAAGYFWVFGGSGYASTGTRGLLNDLWKYNPVTNQWAWMNGADTVNNEGYYGLPGDPLNTPGARYSAISWVDNSGNLWLFGGEGLTPGNPAGFLNDLWKYDVTTNEWTYISGDPAPNQTSEYGILGLPSPGNKPGSRSGSVSWIDASGNYLWLFGGLNYNFPVAGYSNDLWNFNIITQEWTWVKGSTSFNVGGTYGTKGVSDVANNPGARAEAGGWTDGSGNLWLFGGDGFDDVTTAGLLNDLWKFNIATSSWTWMHGSDLVDQPGIYGTVGVPAPANTPGARFKIFTFQDMNGDSWLFGGDGYGSLSQGLLYDLWKYDDVTNQWTWMKGDGNVNMNSIYGTLGTSSPTTRPGGRRGGVPFTDAAGNLWLLGGFGYTETAGPDLLNDLWKLGTAGTVAVRDLQLVASQKENGILLNWITTREVNSNNFRIQRSENGITFTDIAHKAASGNSNSIKNYEHTDFSPLSGINYYRIILTDQSGEVYSNIVIVTKQSVDLLVFPNPVNEVLNIQAKKIEKNSSLLITDISGKILHDEQIQSGINRSGSILVSSLKAGVYFLIIRSPHSIQKQKFIKL